MVLPQSLGCDKLSAFPSRHPEGEAKKTQQCILSAEHGLLLACGQAPALQEMACLSQHRCRHPQGHGVASALPSHCRQPRTVAVGHRSVSEIGPFYSDQSRVTEGSQNQQWVPHLSQHRFPRSHQHRSAAWRKKRDGQRLRPLVCSCGPPLKSSFRNL